MSIKNSIWNVKVYIASYKLSGHRTMILFLVSFPKVIPEKITHQINIKQLTCIICASYSHTHTIPEKRGVYMKMKNAVGGRLGLSEFLLLFLALFAVGSFDVDFFLWRYNQTIMTNRKHFKKKSTNTEPHKREMKMVQKNVPLSRLICLCRPFHNLSLWTNPPPPTN